ncbi:MAG: DNA-directed RNA polymerase subunit P [Candidatus Altiarchaeota archaeon]|nr:DNA-directed RNA polymerase subunit P [Candidatus Altiarchaeota archaeon]
MGQYTCLKCGKIVEKIDKTVCPYCSGRILIKTRSSEVRRLKAE